jgi:hypothetical protein
MILVVRQEKDGMKHYGHFNLEKEGLLLNMTTSSCVCFDVISIKA